MFPLAVASSSNNLIIGLSDHYLKVKLPYIIDSFSSEATSPVSIVEPYSLRVAVFVSRAIFP